MKVGRVTVNFNYFEGSGIGNFICDATADPDLSGQFLRDFVNDLPRSVRGIKLIKDTSIRTWQTHIANDLVAHIVEEGLLNEAGAFVNGGVKSSHGAAQ